MTIIVLPGREEGHHQCQEQMVHCEAHDVQMQSYQLSVMM